MEINLALEKFYQYLSSGKNIKETSIKNYKEDLTQFFKFFNDKKDTNDLYSTDIETYLNNELNVGHSVSTALRRLSTTKEFFYFLNREKIINISIPKIETPKVIHHAPEILNFEEVEAFLNAPNIEEGDELRDKAMIELMYGSGLRVNEMMNIKINDIDFKNKMITIHGTGKNNRKVPITEFALEFISQYINNVRRFSIHRELPYLFLTRYGTHLTRQYFFMKVKEYAKRAGIEKNISPSTLRHSFATHMIEKGSKLVSLQKILGHSSIYTTEVYSKLSNKRIKDAYDSYIKNK